MRKAVILVAAALAFGGCKKDPPPAAGSAPPVARQPAAAAPAQDENEPAGQLVLTAPMLAAFLEYQQKMLLVQAQAVQDLQAMDAKLDAGRYTGLTGEIAVAHDAVTSIQRREEAEAAARKETGLSERDAELIETMVGDVIMKREVGRTMNLEGTLRQMEQMRSLLPKDQQAGVDQSIAELRKQEEELKGLKEEREKYGAANVELLLTREADLVKNHEKLMNLWSVKP